MKYTFKGCDGDYTTVETAGDEDEARHLAMVKRWGRRASSIEPSLPNGKYAGRGLELFETAQ